MFVSIVDAGGFSAAARATGARKALLSRRLQELERRLGARLLERTTRVVRLTEVGAVLHEQAGRAIAMAREATVLAAAGRNEPVGCVRVSTTAPLADLLLRPVVVTYLERYPRASVEVDVSSRPVDLVREGFDVAIRVGAAAGPNLVSRVIGRGRTVNVATANTLARFPAIATPKDVERVDAVVITGSGDWLFRRGKVDVRVRPRVRLATPSYLLAREAILADVGVGRLPSFLVAADVAAKRLVPVLEAWMPREVRISVVFPGRELLAAKTRAFVDLLTEHVSKSPLPTIA